MSSVQCFLWIFRKLFKNVQQFLRKNRRNFNRTTKRRPYPTAPRSRVSTKMKHKELNGTHVLVLLEGEKLIESITDFCSSKKIAAATFTVIGALREVELGFYDLAAKEYHWKKIKAELELDSATGNVAVLEGKPLVHAHATVSDNEMHAFGGHLKEAIIGASCEVFLTPLQEKIERKPDEKTGLNLLMLD